MKYKGLICLLLYTTLNATPHWYQKPSKLENNYWITYTNGKTIQEATNKAKIKLKNQIENYIIEKENIFTKQLITTKRNNRFNIKNIKILKKQYENNIIYVKAGLNKTTYKNLQNNLILTLVKK